jgi:hypothetical protein
MTYSYGKKRDLENKIARSMRAFSKYFMKQGRFLTDVLHAVVDLAEVQKGDVTMSHVLKYLDLPVGYMGRTYRALQLLVELEYCEKIEGRKSKLEITYPSYIPTAKGVGTESMLPPTP